MSKLRFKPDARLLGRTRRYSFVACLTDAFHAETAREFLEDGITVQVVCKAKECIHWANLTMPMLIQRVGWDAQMWLC